MKHFGCTRVMFDFEIQRCTRRCAQTQRELSPGEWYYCVLRREGADIVREDYCTEAWRGPPPEAWAWWKSRIPELGGQRLHWAPGEVLLNYFEQLSTEEAQADLRYILGLLLVRRRLARWEGTVRDSSAGQAEFMVLYCPRTEQEYRVAVVQPEPGRLRQIQDELSRLLSADAT